MEHPPLQHVNSIHSMGQHTLASVSSASVEQQQQDVLRRSLSSLVSVPSFSYRTTAVSAAVDSSSVLESPTYRDYFTRYTTAIEAVQSLRNSTNNTNNNNNNNQQNTCINEPGTVTNNTNTTSANTNLAAFCSTIPAQQSELQEWEKHLKIETERRTMMDMLLKDTDAKENRSRLQATHQHISGHYSKLFHNCDPRVFEADFMHDSNSSSNDKDNSGGSNGNNNSSSKIGVATSTIPTPTTPSNNNKKDKRRHSFYRSKMTQLIVSSPSYIKPDTLFRNFSIASGMHSREMGEEHSFENRQDLLEEYIQCSASVCGGEDDEAGSGSESGSEGYGEVTESAEDICRSAVMSLQQLQVSAEDPAATGGGDDIGDLTRAASSRNGKRQQSAYTVDYSGSSSSTASGISSPVRGTTTSRLPRTTSCSTNADTNPNQSMAAAISTYGTAFANPEYPADSPKLGYRKVMSKKASSFGTIRSTTGSTRNVHTTFQFDVTNKRDIIGRQTTSVRGQSKLHDAALDFIQDQCLNSIDALNLKRTSVQNRDILIGWQVGVALCMCYLCSVVLVVCI